MTELTTATHVNKTTLPTTLSRSPSTTSIPSIATTRSQDMNTMLETINTTEPVATILLPSTEFSTQPTVTISKKITPETASKTPPTAKSISLFANSTNFLKTTTLPTTATIPRTTTKTLPTITFSAKPLETTTTATTQPTMTKVMQAKFTSFEASTTQTLTSATSTIQSYTITTSHAATTTPPTTTPRPTSIFTTTTQSTTTIMPTSMTTTLPTKTKLTSKSLVSPPSPKALTTMGNTSAAPYTFKIQPTSTTESAGSMPTMTTFLTSTTTPAFTSPTHATQNNTISLPTRINARTSMPTTMSVLKINVSSIPTATITSLTPGSNTITTRAKFLTNTVTKDTMTTSRYIVSMEPGSASFTGSPELPHTTEEKSLSTSSVNTTPRPSDAFKTPWQATVGPLNQSEDALSKATSITGIPAQTKTVKTEYSKTEERIKSDVTVNTHVFNGSLEHTESTWLTEEAKTKVSQKIDSEVTYSTNFETGTKPFFTTNRLLETKQSIEVTSPNQKSAFSTLVKFSSTAQSRAPSITFNQAHSYSVSNIFDSASKHFGGSPHTTVYKAPSSNSRVSTHRTTVQTFEHSQNISCDCNQLPYCPVCNGSDAESCNRTLRLEACPNYDDICKTEVEWNVKGVFIRYERFCSQDRNCSGNLDVQSCLASGATRCTGCMSPTCGAVLPCEYGLPQCYTCNSTSEAECQQTQTLKVCPNANDTCKTEYETNVKGVVVTYQKFCAPLLPENNGSGCGQRSVGEVCQQIDETKTRCEIYKATRDYCLPSQPTCPCGLPKCFVCNETSEENCAKNQILQTCDNSEDFCMVSVIRDVKGVVKSYSKSCSPRLQCNSLAHETCNMLSDGGQECRRCGSQPDSCACNECLASEFLQCPFCNASDEKGCLAMRTLRPCNTQTDTCVKTVEYNSKGVIKHVQMGCQSQTMCNAESYMQDGSCTEINKQYICNYCNDSNRVCSAHTAVTPATSSPPITNEPGAPCSCGKPMCYVCYSSGRSCTDAILQECPNTDDVCHRETLIDVRGTYIYDHRYCSSSKTCPDLGILFTERRADSSTYTNYCNKIPDKCPICPENPCVSNPCKFGGTCKPSGTGYQCICPCGWKGPNCSELDRFFPFGPLYQDNVASFFDQDDGCLEIRLPQPFQFGCKLYHSFFISVNGFITFKDCHQMWTPQAFPLTSSSYFEKIPMMAPFWADIDLSYGNGTIYHHCYKRDVSDIDLDPLLARDKYIFDFTTQQVQKHTGDTGFVPSMVCTVTWYNVSPYPSETYHSERACFQLVLASDHRTRRTYSIYNYNNLGWKVESKRPNSQGFQSEKTDLFDSHQLFSNFYTSGSSNAYQLPVIKGPLGPVGQWYHKTTASSCERPNITSEFLCQNWYLQQDKEFSSVLRFLDYLNVPDCPCWFWQAAFHPKFIVDYFAGCAVSAFPVSGFPITQKCCYKNDGSLITTPSYEAGSLLMYHPSYYARFHLDYDLTPKMWCCLESNNCDLYYKVRPINKCFQFVNPFAGLTFGEPHIKTPDGLEYTLNSLGEFWVIKSNLFSLQGRTQQITDDKNEHSSVTVFKAFAAKDLQAQTLDGVLQKSARVFVELSSNNSFKIWVDEDLVTAWFEAAVDGSSNAHYPSVVLMKKNNQLICHFPSGVSLHFAIGYEDIQCEIIISSELRANNDFLGLYGNIDGNPSNDLMAADGTVLDPDASEETIFKKFGQSWRIQNANESLFVYDTESGETFESYQNRQFVPSFGVPETVSQQLISDGKKFCSHQNSMLDYSCFYDYVNTNGNDKLAGVTLRASMNFNDTISMLAANVPYISIEPAEMQWMVSKSNSTVIRIISSDSNAQLHINKAFTYPDHYGSVFVNSVTNSAWTFTWAPSNLDPVNLTFTGSDSFGNEAVPMTVMTKLCDCNDHGLCQWDLPHPRYNQSDIFQVVSCLCHSGLYHGDHCEQDFDFCADDPCGDASNCTALTTAQYLALRNIDVSVVGYVCSGCPQGFQLIGQKCQDVNECGHDQLNNCSTSNQICVNTHGSYTCECANGFTMNWQIGKCSDIDECGALLSDCDQICVNSVGGYSCECVSGYSIHNNRSCTPNNESLNTSCSCSYCSSSVMCGCAPGYSNETGVTCIELDECSQQTDECSDHSHCTNLPGSYLCGCESGYQLDSDNRTCISCSISRPGFWGKGCQNVCQCPANECSSISGCTSCNNPGWKGPDCDQDVNECTDQTNVCPENSWCLNTNGSFMCVCQPWYQMVLGKCILLDACKFDEWGNKSLSSLRIQRCLNGACVDGNISPGNFACICSAGYTGSRCEIDIDNCAGNPCFHGGNCTDFVDRFDCSCSENHYGTQCQWNVSTTFSNAEAPNVSTTSSNTEAPSAAQSEYMTSVLLPSVLGAVLGILLLLLTILITVLVCLRCCPSVIRSATLRQKEQKEFESAEEPIYHIDARIPRPRRLHWYPALGFMRNFSQTPEPVALGRVSASHEEPARAFNGTDTGQQVPEINWSVLQNFRQNASGEIPPMLQRGLPPLRNPRGFLWKIPDRNT